MGEGFLRSHACMLTIWPCWPSRGAKTRHPGAMNFTIWVECFMNIILSQIYMGGDKKIL